LKRGYLVVKAKSKARPSVLIKTKAGFFSLKRGYLVVKAKSKARPSVLIKTKAGFFSLKRGYLVVKAKSKARLSVLKKTKAEQQTSLVVTFFRLFVQRGRVALLLNGGLNKYIAVGCWVLLIPPPAWPCPPLYLNTR
jgi:hypothetical protein